MSNSMETYDLFWIYMNMLNKFLSSFLNSSTFIHNCTCKINRVTQFHWITDKFTLNGNIFGTSTNHANMLVLLIIRFDEFLWTTCDYLISIHQLCWYRNWQNFWNHPWFQPSYWNSIQWEFFFIFFYFQESTSSIMMLGR